MKNGEVWPKRLRILIRFLGALCYLHRMAEKIIYSMVGVSKIYPPNKQVIRDISLSYFYGAKIGVLGSNGSGKSTLLKVMAGDDTEINGEAMLSPGYRVGFLRQEPELDEDKTVKENVMEGYGRGNPASSTF